MSSIPIIDPTGKAWDIPAAKAPDALKAGGKLGIPVVGPDDSKWLIPQDQVHAAIAKGGKLMGAAPSVPQPEMSEQPLSMPEKFAAHLSTGLENVAVKPVIHASAPSVAAELYKHLRGEPNNLKDIPGDAVATFLMAGGAGETAEAGNAADKPVEATQRTQGSGNYEARTETLTSSRGT